MRAPTGRLGLAILGPALRAPGALEISAHGSLVLSGSKNAVAGLGRAFLAMSRAPAKRPRPILVVFELSRGDLLCFQRFRLPLSGPELVGNWGLREYVGSADV
jgi:hypothetical protein